MNALLNNRNPYFENQEGEALEGESNIFGADVASQVGSKQSLLQ
jgi:hypothetical protein